MGALLKLIFSGGVPKYSDGSGWIEGDVASLEAGATAVNFSDKKLGVPGAVIIAAWLSSKKDKGAMTSLSLASNGLGVEGAKIIAAVLPKCT
jgi:hypothetical protein